ncbi:hypothetical protein ACO0M4_39115 [Streptomyces sp. RGM 3693]|uniref:hypothetical protein n=1 Tax=Streptomyces sp. RGM 3693 TaxID=3413284 RepID=UPI003D2AAEEE
MTYESSTPYRAGDEGYPSSGLPAGHSDLVRPDLVRFRLDLDLVRFRLVRLDRGNVGLPYATGDRTAHGALTVRRIPLKEPA